MQLVRYRLFWNRDIADNIDYSNLKFDFQQKQLNFMCPFSPVNSWNQIQSFDYFEIQRKRIEFVDLGWV